MNSNATARPSISFARLSVAGISERIRRLAFSAAPSSTLLVRGTVGAVFLLEGILKFLDPQGLGVGRFVKIGIPFPGFFAPFDATFEIVCGLCMIAGLLTRLSAIPMIVNMIVAIGSTKIPLLLHEGFWKAAHEARLDFTMLFASLFLLLAGAGPLSLDFLLLARWRPRP
jgi:putative oxidoreductase